RPRSRPAANCRGHRRDERQLLALARLARRPPVGFRVRPPARGHDRQPGRGGFLPRGQGARADRSRAADVTRSTQPSALAEGSAISRTRPQLAQLAPDFWAELRQLLSASSCLTTVTFSGVRTPAPRSTVTGCSPSALIGPCRRIFLRSISN